LELGKFYCSACGDTFNEYDSRPAREGEVEYNEEDNEQLVYCCPHCGAHEEDSIPQDIESDWNYYIEEFQSQMQKAFSSLQICNKWIGWEDLVLLENTFCYVGVSEYLGLVSMWVVPKEADYYSPPSFENLRDHWIDQIGQRFEKIAHTCFGQPLKLTGYMSNGEGLYQRLSA
jgi:DNA-directed RNA polymerase subunit RPC12/RpoP